MNGCLKRSLIASEGGRIVRRKVSARTLRYLSSKDMSTYTELDSVLSFYASGQFEETLLLSGATEIEFFPETQKIEKSIQICFNYHNLSATLDFSENYYEHCVYLPNTSADEIERQVNRCQYEYAFNTEQCIQNLMEIIKSDARLKNTVKKRTSIIDKGKLYSIASVISFLAPFIIIGILAMYKELTGEEVSISSKFAAIIIIVSVAISGAFSGKSRLYKKNKEY